MLRHKVWALVRRRVVRRRGYRHVGQGEELANAGDIKPDDFDSHGARLRQLATAMSLGL